MEDMQMHSEPVQEPEEKKEKKVSWQENLLLYLHDFIYLVAVVVVLFAMFFRVVVVSGRSMNSTLLDGDYLLLLGDVFYTEPKQGDVIVASKESFDDGMPIVKRIIAVGGQWVDIDFVAGIVYVGDSQDTMQPLDEWYLQEQNITTDFEGVYFPVQVPENSVFVLGDNRGNSTDSRSPRIGMIDEREILGKVIFLFLPGTNKGTVKADYGRIGLVK